MTDLTPILDQLRTFAEQSGHADIDTLAVPAAIVCLVAGIGLSVLGAKLARPAITIALAALGGTVGVWFARTAGFSYPIGAVVGTIAGAVVFGTIAYRTFTVWVGVGTALVFSSLALGTLGGQRVFPHYAEFAETMNPVLPDSVGFAVPSPEQRDEYLTKPPRETALEFWAFVTDEDASVATQGQLLGVGAAVAGLFLGVVAVRWMLIVSSALLGTALLAAGVGTLLRVICTPESFQALQSHSTAMGMGVGAVLVTSLILQTLLTRKAPSDREKVKAKAKT
ncbi:MAG: hypothetical protein ACE5HE_02005 [Phycisphaerae bacterium]